MELYDHQINALKRMHNGCILNGGVGTGKSRTALAYYFFYIAKGVIPVNGKGDFKEPMYKIPLYIITPAMKRNTGEWESEMVPFFLSSKKENYGIKVVIDSWNNIQKYSEVKNAFFIFDEQRVVGKGAWSKTFIKISKFNRWILLSATPGDTWSDYIPVFIANGFYRNRTEFNSNHVIFSTWTKFPKVDRYINTGKLMRLRNDILVDMTCNRDRVIHDETIIAGYDKRLYKFILSNRWDPYENEPIEKAAKMGYLLRRAINSDKSRLAEVRKLLANYPRSIIFYNYDFELEMLEKLCKTLGIQVAEYNGHKHESIPDTDQWVYLVNYGSGSEAWNCTITNVIIFFSQNNSYRNTIQAKGRIDRMNTPYHDLYYYTIRSNAPIDLEIHKRLLKKKDFNMSAYFKNFGLK